MAAGTTGQARPLPRTLRQSNPWLARITLILVSIIVLTNLAAALLAAGYQVYYDGLIFPGVSVWGVDLSGKTPEEAAAALAGQFTYPQTATITFRDGSNIWPITAGELGVRFDVARTVQAAYEVGRQPGLIASLRQQVTAWREGVVISPVIVYDQTAAQVFLDAVAAQINRPPLDAGILIQNAEAVTTPGQIGRHLDTAATLEALGGLITSLQSGEVELAVVETPPRIEDASETAALVNRILAQDLQIYIEEPLPGDPGPWAATRAALADMLVIERQPAPGDDQHDIYTIRLNPVQFYTFLDPLVEELAAEPVDARLLFNEDTGELEVLTPGQEGRTLDIEATVALIQERVLAGEHSVPLVFETIAPTIPSDATAEELGITEMIASATTYFAGSSAGRRANVREAASRFNGVVIAPGEVFSFNEHLGDVSQETGFEEAYIIYNGRTIKGVGGGVCQVSTTAFQAAFYAGFPILERYPHAYRVGYYEVGEGVGMDATVFSPLVDLRFQNDTPYHLLIETSTDVDRATVTFRFYSTSDGRTVQKDGPYVSSIVPHGPPIYEENPELAPGQVKQVDWAVDGATVRVNRTVYRDGQILYQDTFISEYRPWQAVYQVGPG
ncbi:MAG: VanW family protein [Anaerolineae bacterium]